MWGQRPHSPYFLEVSLQAILVIPQCTLEHFGGRSGLGGPGPGRTVLPQLRLHDAVQGVMARHHRNSPNSVCLREAPYPAWLTGSRSQEGDRGAGQGETLLWSTEAGSFSTGTAVHLRMPRALFKPTLGAFGTV